VLGLSLFATLCSTLSYLAWPGEIIAYGPMLLAAQFAAYPIIMLVAGYGLIPLLMKHFLLLRLGWMATILYATSRTVLVPLLELTPHWTPWLCVLLGISTIAYSAIGGLRAVVISDALQSMMMLAGATITIVVVTAQLGGISAWWPNEWPAHWKAPEWGFDPRSRVSFGAGLMSIVIWYICTTGSDHMSIQRFLATRNPQAARQTLAISLSTDMLVTVLLALTGLTLLAWYTIQPQQFPSGHSWLQSADELFPRFILTGLPIGLGGLVIAAILSAAMSSLSSGVNSTTAVLNRDFLSLFPGERPQGAAEVRRMRWTSLWIGGLSIGLSILNTLIEGNLIERCYKVVNLLTAPLFVLFFLALFVPFSTPVGAWTGLISSVAVAVCVAYAEDLFGHAPVSFVWMTPLSLLTGVTAGSIVSAITPRRASP
jgi:SSS family solute:Na+ symporter